MVNWKWHGNAGAFDTAIKEWEEKHWGKHRGDFKPLSLPMSEKDIAAIRVRGGIPSRPYRKSGIK